MVPKLDKLKAVSFATGSTVQNNNNNSPEDDKNKKVKPMSKRISTCISQCSAKMTDILSWKAKLTENKVELNLD